MEIFTLAYNLIAILLKKLIHEVNECHDPIALLHSLHEDDDMECYERAKKILMENGLTNENILLDDINEVVCQNILKACNTYNDFHIMRWIVLLLDEKLKWEYFADYQRSDAFTALNTNIMDTDLLILPRVPTIVPFQQEQEIKCADRFYPFLSGDLQNIYYIYHEKLKILNKSYNIRNIIYQPELRENNRESITLAYSPLLCIEDEGIFNISFNEQSVKAHRYNYFSVNGVKKKWEKKIEKCFLQFYKNACEINADIVCSCEMICPQSLYEHTDGYNKLLSEQISQNEMFRAPALILVPTYSYEKKNSLNVYDKNGKFLLTQCKQIPFVYQKDNIRYTEDLSSCDQTIWILHVPGWGRLVFPICKDFLHPEYRDLLIKELKATLVICPSYSNGSRDFERDILAGSPYGTGCFWGNACKTKKENGQGYVGAISGPLIGDASGVKRLLAKCDNDKTCQNCMFKIVFPLHYAGRDRHFDAEIQIEHCCDMNKIERRRCLE